jgi:hypothetical protein
MQNPFKNIVENQKVPEMLRERVMGDIRMIKLSLDLADLVAIKYPSSIADLLSATDLKKKKGKK